MVLGEPFTVLRIKPRQPHARQAPYPLNYLSGPCTLPFGYPLSLVCSCFVLVYFHQVNQHVVFLNHSPGSSGWSEFPCGGISLRGAILGCSLYLLPLRSPDLATPEFLHDLACQVQILCSSLFSLTSPTSRPACSFLVLEPEQQFFSPASL